MCNSAYMFIIWVLSDLPLLYSTSLTHQIATGSLTNAWRFNFSILVDELRGVVLCCIDSKRNQFEVEVVLKNRKERNIIVKLLQNYAAVSLLQLCGCDPCNGKMVHIDIRSDGTYIHIRCNNRLEALLDQASIAGYIQKNVYPLPMVMTNGSDRIFIMIGNVGPYFTEKNVTNLPLKNQMVGCVDKFRYNSVIIEFIGNSSKMRPSCLWRCVNDICNGGMCKERVNQAPNCDCRSTALNGPFCNRSLTVYNRGGYNQYEKVKSINEMYLKMTWKQMLHKMYCLMEIVGEYGHVTVWTNKSHLLIDSSVISDIDVDGINFVNVTIANNILIVTSKSGQLKRKFLIIDLILINIGFCGVNVSLEVFEGDYDVDFLSPQLLLKQSSKSFKIKAITLYCGVLILIILSLLCIASFTMYLRKGGKERTVNFYDEQPMEIIGAIKSCDLNEDSDPYSILLFENADIICKRDEEDSDEYVLPSQYDANEALPSLPPRC